jgi:hypothetical protein
MFIDVLNKITQKEVLLLIITPSCSMLSQFIRIKATQRDGLLNSISALELSSRSPKSQLPLEMTR